MTVYRVRYLFTWFKELKERYQESLWVSVSDDVERVKQEFLATICMNGDLVREDVDILEIRPLGTLIQRPDRKLGVRYDFGEKTVGVRNH